jgi:hypothetical protein
LIEPVGRALRLGTIQNQGDARSGLAEQLDAGRGRGQARVSTVRSVSLRTVEGQGGSVSVPRSTNTAIRSARSWRLGVLALVIFGCSASAPAAESAGATMAASPGPLTASPTPRGRAVR